PDPALIVRDSRGLQTHPLYVRNPTDRDENLVDEDIVMLAMRIDRQTFPAFGFLHLQVFSTAEQLHTIAKHLLFNDTGRISILIGQDAVRRFNQIDLAPKTGEGLRQLAADRPGPDDPQTLRQLGQRKNGFVRQITGFLKAGRIGYGRPRTGTDSGFRESENSITGRTFHLDRIKTEKPSAADIYVYAEFPISLGGVIPADAGPQFPHACHHSTEVILHTGGNMKTELCGFP